MLKFYPVHRKQPIGVGAAATSSMEAFGDVHCDFFSHFATETLERPVNLPITLAHVAGALYSDCGSKTRKAAEARCNDILNSCKRLGIYTSAAISEFELDYKRTDSEALAYPLSLVVAEHYGSRLFGSRTTFNKIWAGKASWEYKWLKEKGPDRIALDLATRQVSFIEAKGTSADVSHKPRKFAEFKTQSLNARLKIAGIDYPIDRYILSYVYRSPGKPVRVQWFNAKRLVTDIEAIRFRRLALQVALTHFVEQLKGAGYGRFVAIHDRKEWLVTFNWNSIIKNFDIDRSATYLFERTYKNRLVLGIDLRAITFFSRLASNQRWLYNNVDANNFFSHLRSLDIVQSKPNPNFHELRWRSATGVALFRRR